MFALASTLLWSIGAFKKTCNLIQISWPMLYNILEDFKISPKLRNWKNFFLVSKVVEKCENNAI